METAALELAPLKLVILVTSLTMIPLTIAMKSAVMGSTTESSSVMMGTATNMMVVLLVAKSLTVGTATVAIRLPLTLALNPVVMVETTGPLLVMTLAMMVILIAVMVAPQAVSLNLDTNAKVVAMIVLTSVMKLVVMVSENQLISTVMMVILMRVMDAQVAASSKMASIAMVVMIPMLMDATKNVEMQRDSTILQLLLSVMMEILRKVMAVMLIAILKLASTVKVVTRNNPIHVTKFVVILLTMGGLTATMETLLVVMDAPQDAILKLVTTAMEVLPQELTPAMKSAVTA
jgi:hypothetical protein